MKRNPIFIEEILPTLKNGSLVVDLGSGTGSFNYNKYPNLEIVSIDVEGTKSKRSNFVRASAENIPLRTDAAYFVVANWVLEHVVNVETCADEISRICCSNASWYVAIPNSSTLEDRLCRITDAISSIVSKSRRKTKVAKGHVQSFTFQRMLIIAYQRGFRLIAFCDWGAGYTFLRKFDKLQRIMIKLIKLLGKTTRKDFFEKSNYLFNFQKIGGVTGYGNFPLICRRCGGGFSFKASIWTCPRCGTLNGR
jgi:ubiquinone/menaquinone biosynthesis C-methylase UbiE